MKLKDIKIQKTLKKTILLNPGPSTTTATVKKSLLQDDICHREGSFAAITRKVADDLVKIVHGKKGDYVATLFAGSGSICIDVAVGSLIPDGKKIMIVNNGFYNDRAMQAAQYYRIPVVNATRSERLVQSLTNTERSSSPTPHQHWESSRSTYTRTTSTSAWLPARKVSTHSQDAHSSSEKYLRSRS